MKRYIGYALLDALLYIYIHAVWSAGPYPMPVSAFKVWLFLNAIVVGLILVISDER